MYNYIEVITVTIREMRKALGNTQHQFAKRYNIPFRTIQNWESGTNVPPVYVMDFLEARVNADLINRRTITIPKYEPNKKQLPKRCDFLGAFAWLKEVKKCLSENFVFALDEALMCQQTFLGRTEEYVIWGYGDESDTRFKGVTLLGTQISKYDVTERDGVKFTNFNRTLTDALTNEDILDMQGITEALSRFYYTHNESFEGVFVPPEYSKRFEELAIDAIEYYTS